MSNTQNREYLKTQIELKKNKSSNKKMTDQEYALNRNILETLKSESEKLRIIKNINNLWN